MRRSWGSWVWLFALAACLYFVPPARAADKPITTLVLIPGATYRDLQPGGKLPAVRARAEQGAVALLHNRVWGDFNENAALVSVGAAERMAAPASGDVSLDALRRFQPAVANRAQKVGAFGAALAGAGVSVSAPSAPLLALNATPAPPDAASVRVMTVSIAGANEYASRLQADTDGAVTYFAAPATPAIARGKPYRALGFLVAIGRGIPPHSLLVSPTTRTAGLVANVDIAPSIVARYGVSIPGAAGAAVQIIPSPAPWTALDAIDRQTVAAARATIPVLLGYGVAAGGAFILALAALFLARSGLTRAARFALLLSASALVALLPVGVLAPQSPLAYAAAVAAVSAGTALAARFIASRFRTEPLRVVYLLLVFAVAADACFGSPVVGRSLLSGNFLTGIRFYGLGNEYSGLLLGASLAALLPWWAYVPLLCAIGLPYFGADAGGTIGAGVGFAVLFFARRGQIRWWHVAAASTVAFAVTGAFAVLDRLQPGAARSHIGAALASGQGAHGVARLLEIVIRKVVMNGRLAVTPWTLVAVAALAPLWIGIGRGVRSRPDWMNALAARSLTGVVLPATVWGAVATAVFNDSGIVAALLLFLPLTVAVLDALLTSAVEQAGRREGTT